MKINKSLNYILPLIYDYLKAELSLEPNYFGKEVLPYIKNSYIRSNNKDCFALLLSNKCDKFLVDCKKSNIFANIIEDEETILIEFDIPGELFGAFDVFKNGSYSYIPEEDKSTIMQFGYKNSKKVYDKICGVLYPDSKMGDRLRKKLSDELEVEVKTKELLSKIIIDDETYRSEKTDD